LVGEFDGIWPLQKNPEEGKKMVLEIHTVRGLLNLQQSAGKTSIVHHDRERDSSGGGKEIN
jgi:hypothetical protein